MTKFGAMKRVLTLSDVRRTMVKMKNTVCAPLADRADALQEEILRGVKKPFSHVIRADLDDVQASGQKPITFYRQVAAACALPSLLETDAIPDDAKSRARNMLSACNGGSVGCYSEAGGFDFLKKRVAEYITRRDGGIPAKYENVVICSATTECILILMEILGGFVTSERVGVMVPLPGYPIHSSALTLFDLEQVSYYLDEDRNWGVDVAELERALMEANKTCNTKVLVVVNPGNPTGQVLSRDNIEAIVTFAERHDLLLVADEAHQDTAYDGHFHSFKKVLSEMGPPHTELQLVSFMSISNGYMGEGGLRGGYMEITNVDDDFFDAFVDLLNTQSPNTIAQAVWECLANPPVRGEPSHESFEAEKAAILGSFATRAKLVRAALNTMPGMTCTAIQGALHAFPRLMLPQKACQQAQAAGQGPDAYYASALLERQGVCVVPGSFLGQRGGTHHFRTTMTPQPDQLEEMLERIRSFHQEFMERYQ